MRFECIGSFGKLTIVFNFCSAPAPTNCYARTHSKYHAGAPWRAGEVPLLADPAKRAPNSSVRTAKREGRFWGARPCGGGVRVPAHPPGGGALRRDADRWQAYSRRACPPPRRLRGALREHGGCRLQHQHSSTLVCQSPCQCHPTLTSLLTTALTTA